MKYLTSELEDHFENSIDLYCQRMEEGDMDMAAAAAAHAEHYLEALYLAQQLQTLLSPEV